MTNVYLPSTLLDLKEEQQAVTDWLVGSGFQPMHSYVADTETPHAESVRMRIPADTYFRMTPLFLLPAVGATLLYFVAIDMLIRASLALAGVLLAELPRPSTRHSIMEHRIRLLAIVQGTVLAHGGRLAGPLRTATMQEPLPPTGISPPWHVPAATPSTSRKVCSAYVAHARRPTNRHPPTRWTNWRRSRNASKAACGAGISTRHGKPSGGRRPLRGAHEHANPGK